MKLQKVYFIWVNREKDAFKWFQQLIDDLEIQLPATFLVIQVYLTEKLNVDDIQNIMIRDCLDSDPITDFTLTRMAYGRPHWFKIFKTIADDYQHNIVKKKIGVFYCGPNPMARVLERMTRTSSRPLLEFVFKQEPY